MDQESWLYEHTPDGAARFVLGTAGTDALVCFGINPSTAVPGRLDRTVTRVRGFAASNGFDSWIMLNVYPQIATDPAGLDRECRPEFTAENERRVAAVLGDRSAVTLLAAWGTLIDSRPYLPVLLRGVVSSAVAAGSAWVSLGDLTRGGHPRHPLRVRADTPLRPFDMGHYLREVL